MVSVTGLTVYVDGSGSYDPDGEVLRYSWTWWDGTPPTPPSSVPMASHTYASAGTYPIRLQVFDNMGEWTLAYQDVTVGLPLPPFPIAGYTYDGYGNPLPGCNVTVTNLNTGASLTNVSDPDYAFYIFDLGTIAYGWQVGDVLRVSATWDTLSASIDVLLTNESTSAGFLQIDLVLRQAGPPPPPFTVYGYTFDGNGNPLIGCSVTVMNVRTGQYLTTVSISPGVYIIDNLNTIVGGWAVYDTIRIAATYGAMSGSTEVVLTDPNAAVMQADVTLS